MANKEKPGRRIGTPFEFQEALKRRLRVGREDIGLKVPEMAAQLSTKIGRDIPADTYRKWESENLLPHDTIIAVCDIIQVHILKFLGPVTEAEKAEFKKNASKKVRYLKPVRSGS